MGLWGTVQGRSLAEREEWKEGARVGLAQGRMLRGPHAPGATASLECWDLPGCPVPLDAAVSLLGPDQRLVRELRSLKPRRTPPNPPNTRT